MRNLIPFVVAVVLSGCGVLVEKQIGDVATPDPAMAGVWHVDLGEYGPKSITVSISGKNLNLSFDKGGDDSRTTASLTTIAGKNYVMMFHPEMSGGITGYAPLLIQSRSATEFVLLAIDPDAMKACLATRAVPGQVKWMSGQAVLSAPAGKAILAMEPTCLYSARSSIRFTRSSSTRN